MSATIDERVAVLKFDNNQFERAIRESSKSLENFKKSLNFNKLAGSLSGIEKAVSRVSFSHLERAIDNISNKFTLLGMVGMNALHRISDVALNAGENVAKLVTGVEGVVDGFREYETQMGAVQTIMANTASKGTTFEQVSDALDNLNKYADQTIYNFTEMTRNIGTFTAAGVDLETSTAAIKGIANLAAVSGSTSQQASTAMYQLSQALASGTVKLMDWNSVVNAGMGGQVFQDAIKETARVHGIAIDEMIEQEGSFRETLSKGWLSSEILLESLQKFTGDLTPEQLRQIGYTEEQITAIQNLGETAYRAATEVKTFTQLADTLKEAAGSGWTQTFEILVGDFYEAKDLWTDISNVVGGMIDTASQNRNNFLEQVFGEERYQSITLDRWQQFANTGLASDTFIESLKYNARQAGVEIDDLIEEYGSFENSLQAGWLTEDMFQSAVDWNARSTEMHFEWSKGLVQQIADGAFGTEEEARAAVEAMGYNYDLYRDLANQYMDPDTYGELDWGAIWNDDAMLDALGVKRTTEEFQAMHDAIEDANSAFNQFLNSKGEGTTGRELLLESLGRIGEHIITIFNVIGEAWNTAFPPMSADSVFNLIQGFHDLVMNAELSEDTLNQLKTIFTGLFDAIGIVGDVLGTVLTSIFRSLSLDTGSEGILQSILDFFESIATKISKFRSFLKTENKLGKATSILTGVFNTLFTVLSGVVGLFTSLTKGEALDFSFLDSLTGTFGNISDIIKGISLRPIGDFLSNIKTFFSDHGVNLDWLDEIIEKLQSLTIGGFIDSVKSKFEVDGVSPFEAIKNMVFGEDGMQFKLPSFDAFNLIGRGLNKIRDIVSAIKSIFGNFDISSLSWDSITSWFSNLTGDFDISEITIFDTIKEKFDGIVDWFSTFDFGPLGTWFDKIKDWFANIKIDFNPIDTIRTKLEELVSWISSFFGTGGSSSGSVDVYKPGMQNRNGMQLARAFIPFGPGGSIGQGVSTQLMALEGAPQEVHEGIDSVFNFIDDLKTKIEDFTNSDAFHSFLDFITNAKDLLPILLGAYGILRIKSFFKGLGDAIGDFASALGGENKESKADTFVKIAAGVDVLCDAISRIAPLTGDMEQLGKGLGVVLGAFATLGGGTTLFSIFGGRFGGITNGVGFVMMAFAIEIIIDALVKILDLMNQSGMSPEKVDHAVLLIGSLEAITGLFAGLGQGLAGLGGIGGFASFGIGFSFMALSNAVSSLIGSVAEVVKLFDESGLEPSSASETLGWLGQFATDFRTNAKEALDTADMAGSYDDGKVWKAAAVIGGLEAFTGIAVGFGTKLIAGKAGLAAFGTGISFLALGHAVGEMMEAVQTVLSWEEQGITKEQIDHAALVVGSLEGFTGVTVGIASALNGISSGFAAPTEALNSSSKLTKGISKGMSNIRNMFGASGNAFTGFGIYSAAKGMGEIAEAVKMLSGLDYEDLESGAEVIRECFGTIITGEVIATIALTAMNLRSVETALMAIGVAFGMFSWGMNQYTDAILKVKNAIGEGEVTEEDFQKYGGMVMSSFASGLQDPEVLESIKQLIGGVFEEITRTIFALFINVYNLLASLVSPIIESIFGEAPKMISSYEMDENGIVTIMMSADEDNINYESLGMQVFDMDAVEEAQEEAHEEAQAAAQEVVDNNSEEIPLEDQIRFLYNIATTDKDENGLFRSAEAKAEAMAQAQELYDQLLYRKAYESTIANDYGNPFYSAEYTYDGSGQPFLNSLRDLSLLGPSDGQAVVDQAIADAHKATDEYAASYGTLISETESDLRAELSRVVDTALAEMPDASPEFVKGVHGYIQNYKDALNINPEDVNAILVDMYGYTEDEIANYEKLRLAFSSIFDSDKYSEITDAAMQDALNDALFLYEKKTTPMDMNLGGIEYIVKDTGETSVVWDVETGRQVIYDANQQVYRLLQDGEEELLQDASSGLTNNINVADFVDKTGVSELAVETYEAYVESCRGLFKFFRDDTPLTEIAASDAIYKPLADAIQSGAYKIGDYLHPTEFDFVSTLYGDPQEAINRFTETFTAWDIAKFLQQPAAVINSQSRSVLESWASPLGQATRQAESFVTGFAESADRAKTRIKTVADDVSNFLAFDKIFEFGKTSSNLTSNPYQMNIEETVDAAVSAVEESEPVEVDVPFKPRFVYEVTSGSAEEGTLWGNVFDTQDLVTYFDTLISGTQFESEGIQFNPLAGIDFATFTATASTAGSDFVNGYISALNDGQDQVVGAATGFAQAALDTVPLVQQSGSPSKITTGYGHEFGEGYRVGIVECISVVAEAASELANAAIRAFENLKDKFYNVGLDSMHGFANGLSAGSSRAIDAAVTTATRALEASKAALEVGSPSKKFEEVGLFSDEGLALGFLRNAHLVEAASTKVGTSAIDRMKSAIKTVNDAMNDDLPTGPTIRPVMDLSEFQNQNSRLHKALNSYGDQLYGKLEGIDESTMGNARNLTQVYIDGARVNDVPEMEETFRDMLVYYKRLGLMNNGRRTRY